MVSIIVPVYNAELYLKECVDSILRQTHLDWELILVDDGSTDASGYLIDRYADSDRRIRALHTANGGLSVARNNGLNAAYGEYIVFVDADDMLHPRAVETLLRHAKGHPFHLVKSRFLRGHAPAFGKINIKKPRLRSCDDSIADSLYQRPGTHNSASAVLYPRAIFDRQRFREGILYEDLDSFYRFIDEAEGVINISDKLYFYRDTPGSLTNEWTDKRRDVLDVTERIERHFQSRSRKLRRAARSRRFSANYNIFLLATANGDQALASQCWDHICQRRAAILFDPRTRLRNKLGALLSYLGRGFVSKLS